MSPRPSVSKDSRLTLSHSGSAATTRPLLQQRDFGITSYGSALYSFGSRTHLYMPMHVSVPQAAGPNSEEPAVQLRPKSHRPEVSLRVCTHTHTHVQLHVCAHMSMLGARPLARTHAGRGCTRMYARLPTRTRTHRAAGYGWCGQKLLGLVGGTCRAVAAKVAQGGGAHAHARTHAHTRTPRAHTHLHTHMVAYTRTGGGAEGRTDGRTDGQMHIG